MKDKSLKIYALANELAVPHDPSELRIPFGTWPFGDREIEGEKIHITQRLTPAGRGTGRGRRRGRVSAAPCSAGPLEAGSGRLSGGIGCIRLVVVKIFPRFRWIL